MCNNNIFFSHCSEGSITTFLILGSMWITKNSAKNYAAHANINSLTSENVEIFLGLIQMHMVKKKIIVHEAALQCNILPGTMALTLCNFLLGKLISPFFVELVLKSPWKEQLFIFLITSTREGKKKNLFTLSLFPCAVTSWRDNDVFSSSNSYVHALYSLGNIFTCNLCIE